MTFIPYSTQNITAEDIEAVSEALKSDFLTQGPQIPRFEGEFAKRHEIAHGVAVSNATGGLHIALLALGVGPGSRVWTCPNSFVASANSALYCGATVDFVDIDADTRNMSILALQKKLERSHAEGRGPNVVIPVDFSGLPCDMQQIRELADVYNFKIVEDASHATGAVYQGRPVGSQYADISVFSFHAVKIVTTSEGGMVCTNDGAIAKALRLLRSHGISRDLSANSSEPKGLWEYEQILLGYNYRMTDIQAALGVSQLRRLEELRDLREGLAARYDELLAGLPLILPPRLTDRRSAWHLYVIEIDSEATRRTRAEVFDLMRREGIGVNVHYIPIHTQPYYQRLGFKWGDFPSSERYYNRAITIPLFPAMTTAQQVRVADSLASSLVS